MTSVKTEVFYIVVQKIIAFLWKDKVGKPLQNKAMKINHHYKAGGTGNNGGEFVTIVATVTAPEIVSYPLMPPYEGDSQAKNE